ncbi:MAG: hypothetical protein KTR31_28800 [Myxococcales bacterium]|nr:hypothetical protein [Myxococcales bacterium]
MGRRRRSLINSKGTQPSADEQAAQPTPLSAGLAEDSALLAATDDFDEEETELDETAETEVDETEVDETEPASEIEAVSDPEAEELEAAEPEAEGATETEPLAATEAEPEPAAAPEPEAPAAPEPETPAEPALPDPAGDDADTLDTAPQAIFTMAIDPDLMARAEAEAMAEITQGAAPAAPPEPETAADEATAPTVDMAPPDPFGVGTASLPPEPPSSAADPIPSVLAELADEEPIASEDSSPEVLDEALMPTALEAPPPLPAVEIEQPPPPLPSSEPAPPVDAPADLDVGLPSWARSAAEAESTPAPPIPAPIAETPPAPIAEVAPAPIVEPEPPVAPEPTVDASTRPAPLPTDEVLDAPSPGQFEPAALADEAPSEQPEASPPEHYDNDPEPAPLQPPSSRPAPLPSKLGSATEAQAPTAKATDADEEPSLHTPAPVDAPVALELGDVGQESPAYVAPQVFADPPIPGVMDNLTPQPATRSRTPVSEGLGDQPSYIDDTPPAADTFDPISWADERRRQERTGRGGGGSSDLLRGVAFVGMGIFGLALILIIVLFVIERPRPVQEGLISNEPPKAGLDAQPGSAPPDVVEPMTAPRPPATKVRPKPEPPSRRARRGDRTETPAAAPQTEAGPPTLRIRSNRKVLVYVDGRPIGYTPQNHVTDAGPHSVSAVVPGQPATRQTRSVTLSSDDGAVAVEFTF